MAPEGWVHATLDELGDLFCGQSVSASAVNSVGMGTVYITGPEQWDGKRLHVNKWTETPARCVPAGSIFITVKGAGVGTTFPGIAAAIGRDVYAYKPNENVDRAFIHRAIDHRIGKIIEDARGVIPGLSREHLDGHALKLPPVAEQRRIVAKLDALTARLACARAELDRVPALAAKLRKQSLSDALQGILAPSFQDEWTRGDQEKLAARRRSYLRDRRGSRLRSDLSEMVGVLDGDRTGWLDCQLADVITLRVGYAFKSADFSKTDGTPLLRGANVAPGRVDWTDQVRLRPEAKAPTTTYTLDAGDIVIAMDRPVIAAGLKIARIKDADAGALLVQRVANPRPTTWIDPGYLMAVLRSDLFMRQIESHATGTDLPHISGNDILTTPCPLPPMTVQKGIVARLNAVFARADRLEAEAARARALIDRLESAILAKAFRGELVPQDPNDELASVLLDRIRAQRAAAPKPKRGRAARASA